MTDAETLGERVLEVGTRVEVRDSFEGKWHRGFVVEEVLDGGYRVRRGSDDSVLPGLLSGDAVRREKRNSMWWI